MFCGTFTQGRSVPDEPRPNPGLRSVAPSAQFSFRLRPTSARVLKPCSSVFIPPTFHFRRRFTWRDKSARQRRPTACKLLAGSQSFRPMATTPIQAVVERVLPFAVLADGHRGARECLSPVVSAVAEPARAGGHRRRDRVGGGAASPRRTRVSLSPGVAGSAAPAAAAVPGRLYRGHGRVAIGRRARRHEGGV
jgi:hypothetical protein